LCRKEKEEKQREVLEEQNKQKTFKVEFARFAFSCADVSQLSELVSSEEAYLGFMQQLATNYVVPLQNEFSNLLTSGMLDRLPSLCAV
jgi:hypothetical protein